MKAFRYNRWLLLFIAIGLVAALTISCQRHAVEQANRQVDLVLNYEDVVDLAEREGLPVEEVLQKTKEAGVTSLAVYDRTFTKLNDSGKAMAVSGSQLIARYHEGSLADPSWRALVAAGAIKGDEVYVMGHDPLTWQELKEDLPRRLGNDRVRTLNVGGEEVLAVKAKYADFLKLNLGLPTDELQAVNAAGFYVLARPANYENVTAEDVHAAFSRLDGIKVSEIVFSGKEVLGAPDNLWATIDEMKARRINLGLIEAVSQLQFYKQSGMEFVARNLGYDKVARLYAVPKDEQPKLTIGTVVERWSNTDEERNIRIDLMRPYNQPAPGMGLLETNLKYFQMTHDQLVAHGYTIGPAGTFADYQASRVLRALVMVGVAAAGILYLSLVIPRLNASRRWQLGLFACLAILAAVPVLLGMGNKIRLVAALASANLFPALAIIWLLDRVRGFQHKADISLVRLVLTGVLALFVTGALSYIGAAYLSGSLADTQYFLEFNIFRGIKLTFILPMVLVAIAFMQRFDIFDGSMDDTAGVWEQCKRILDAPIRVKSLLVLLVVLLAGLVFIARSGHTMGMPVSQTELHFRAFLEKAFYARPRTKELLVGHPAFMLAVMAFCRKWPTMVFFALVLIATIGQGSMVETFAHMRTPVYMSFMRGLGGLGLGAVIGAVAMMLVAFWQSIVARANKKKESQAE